MFADDARLCSDAIANSLGATTGAALGASCASDYGSEPSPTPSDSTPRPQDTSPPGAAPVVPFLEWRALTPELVRRVGARAWAVWRELVELRDAYGDCRATAAGIGRRLSPGLTRRQVQRQIDRLNQLGLVVGGGWRYATVPEGDRQALVEVYERRVVGDRIGSRVGLPATVWARVGQAGRGGSRPGAGRRNQKRSGLAVGAGGADCAGSLTAFDYAETGSKTVTRNHAESLEKESKAVTEVREEENNYSMSFVFWLFEPEKKERAERALSPSGVQRAEGAGAPSEQRGGAVEATREVVLDGSLGDDLPVTRDEGAGVGLAGRGRRRVIGASEWATLPPCPGPAVIAPAAIPGPPLIRLDTTEEDRVRLCLTAYNLICRRRLPREFNPYDRKPLKPADRKVLVAAAAALCDHEVSPIRWVEFSMDQWQHAQKAATQAAQDAGKKVKRQAARPPLRMVFSPARIGEHAGWCRHERERRGSRVIWTRSLRSLMARWQQMRAAVLRGELTPAAACEKFFPGDAWDRQVAKAREDARKEQARINTEIESGEYLW